MAQGPLGNVIRWLRRSVGPVEGLATDRQLLARYAGQHDEAAFALLVERHGPMVWSACRRVLGEGPDAEDAFQATFLVLARKADASGWQESISSWLYEVAYRVALRARRDFLRRRQRESEAAAMIPERSPPAADHAELRALLDAELTCLPEKYRAPLVLCYLQGQTNDEAARLLGWTRGTVASRLSRARDLLRQRLTRRGLALPVAALAVSLTESAAPAAVPPALLAVTLKSVNLLSMAQAGALSASALTLAEGVLQAMFIKKLKWAALTVLALAVFGLGTGLVAYRSFFAPPNLVLAVPLEVQPPAGPKPPAASEPAVKDGLAVTVQPTKAVFGKDENPGIEFTFTNRTKDAFRLAAMNYFPERTQEVIADEVRTGVRWIGHYIIAPRTASAPPVPAEVAADGAVKRSLLLGKSGWDSWSWRLPGDMRSARQLPPGKYRLSFHLKWGAGLGNEKQGFWVGEITTNPVELEIVNREVAKPVVKDGLSVAVLTAKDYYTAGEAPAVVVNLTNTTNKILTLQHP
ncbi:MAG: sigma-70 family RNA polymerase sigma factor, partial [Planctomycetia bacterium]|nr:sigma-70 family RNA polymerase sigma factor [Planctomycetia bacterium]